MKIISGGQTGVDRAALDAAIDEGLDYGGSIPRGRRAEDGRISETYRDLTELPSPQYEVRTEKNVVDADATLVLTVGIPSEGTALTVGFTRKHQKPVLVIDIGNMPPRRAADEISRWIRSLNPHVLNVAGPRESKIPGIYRMAGTVLKLVMAELRR